MRIARIAFPGAIYDDSVAAQTFADGGTFGYFGKRRGGILENGEKEAPAKEMK